jgi:GT2 family glycosyltransferase
MSYAVGVINYRSYDDLKACLDSLERQTHRPTAVLVVDVDPDDDRQEALRDRPAVDWEETGNAGFSAAANLAIRRLREKTDASFILVLNPDVRLDAEFSERLLEEMRQRPRVALGTGKLLRPEGVIDSAGIELPRHRRPRDRGSEEVDRGQYERVELVFGASGAAMMLRTAALADLAIQGEVFDEDFFLYHEDTDLSWRAQLLGWQVLYVPDARACHNRSWRRDRRFEIRPEIRRHSFKNHYLQLIKNERPRDFWRNLPVIASWEVLRLGFAILRDPRVLPGYLEAGRLAPSAWRKRRLLQIARRARLEA